MRHALSAQPVDTYAGPIHITASFGLATMDKGQELHADSLIRVADEALYRAKRAGRNRLEGL
jgi:diguanylate cyclase (GGDEF)-like protein